MLLEWSWKAGVRWVVVPKAPDPTQRSKNGHYWFVPSERPPPLNGISLLNGKVFLTREVMQEKERYSKVRPNVQTQRGERTCRGHMEQKKGIWYPQKARTRGKTERRQERGRDRGADQLPPCVTCEKVSKPLAAFERIVRHGTRKGMQVLGQK